MNKLWKNLSAYAPWFVDFWYYIVMILLFIILAITLL